jgi:hypothetical protein
MLYVNEQVGYDIFLASAFGCLAAFIGCGSWVSAGKTAVSRHVSVEITHLYWRLRYASVSAFAALS